MYVKCFSFSTAMEVLDGDDVRLSSRGRYAERDIVQVLLTFLFVSLCFLLCVCSLLFALQCKYLFLCVCHQMSVVVFPCLCAHICVAE